MASLQEALTGRYRLEAVVHDLPRATVYRGKSSINGEAVAIRILKEPEPALVARLQQECPLMEQLHHPNIERVIEIDHVDGVWFVATEYIEGETLASRLASGPLAHQEAIALIQDVLEGLVACHRQGVLHRYLAPERIRIGKDGHARVTDLGLAPVGISTVAEDVQAVERILRQLLVDPTGPTREILDRAAEAHFTTAAEFRDALLALQPRPVRRWPRALAALATLLLVLGIALHRPEPDTGPALAEATRLEAQRRYREAEAVLRSVITGTRAIEARSALIRILVIEGKGVEAEVEARHILKIEPTGPEARGYLALSLGCQRRFGEAIATLSDAVGHGLRHARYHAWLARMAEAANQTQALGEIVRSGLALEPGFPELQLSLCRFDYQTGKYAEALQVAEKILKVSPADATALYLKGLVLIQQRQNAGAEEALVASLKANANQPILHHVLGRLLEIRGAVDRAEAEFRRALEVSPCSWDALVSLNALLVDEGRVTEMNGYLDGLRKTCPNLPIVRLLTANAGEASPWDPAAAWTRLLVRQPGERSFACFKKALAKHSVPDHILEVLPEAPGGWKAQLLKR